MKKAFTLFELVISLILSGIILTILSKPLWEFYQLNNKNLKTKELIINTHLTLLKIEKLFQSCANINIIDDNLIHCFLKDDLLALKDKNTHLLNSTLILENNTTLYSPKSDLQTQLQNRKALYKDEQNIIYGLNNNKIQKIFILSENNLSSSFIGNFIPISAELNFTFKDDQIYYEIKPRFNDELKQSAILAKNISFFKIQNSKLKICMKNQKQEYCLEKRLFL
ncbi:prepilin-type N-terminal cleavage/methylation domain-containing protein [Campylobacter sp. RM10532]|uniref:prepilin-type N-terminal cleavage/methylation domain-containing protein n=1 Tax=Campylobacter TaxID=194 RepID=UPI00301BB493|nr:prepilin-type N-terminal cleavage/methylation domain-containing protein [Campylobacter sp. RM13744]MBZ7945148.1 prepilin-type N-terminal cleavage/methylation domain-containing protein [Campylobacter sp. RM10532]MBZ7955271.1 prepilin-type N-terminal cleavage/methylation domain-containing protein [Campylobacter sp. RM17709]